MTIRYIDIMLDIGDIIISAHH